MRSSVAIANSKLCAAAFCICCAAAFGWQASASLRVEEAPGYRPALAPSLPILSLDVSPDGKLLAVPRRSEVLLCEAAAAAQGRVHSMRRLADCPERIETVRFSPDGSSIALVGGSPGETGEWQLWDIASGRQLQAGEATDDVLFGLSWSPDGKRIAFGSTDGKLFVVETASGRLLTDQAAHADWVLDTAFSADGQHLASGSRDRTLKLTAVESGRLVDNITSVSPGNDDGRIACVARHPRQDVLAVGGIDGSLRTFQFERAVERKIGDDSNLLLRYPRQQGTVFSVAFAPQGDAFAAAGGIGQQGWLRMWRVPPRKEPPTEILKILLKPLEEQSDAERSQLAAYRRADSSPLREFAGVEKPLYASVFAPNGELLFSAGEAGKLYVHETATGQLAAKLDFGESPSAPVQEGDDTSERPVRFITDVMPILSKAGCNAGSCHGAADGQNGFKLSLRGYDPWFDYRALTQELKGRRIDRLRPEHSLALLKASESITHGGGTALDYDSRHYQTFKRWIEAGAGYDAAAPRVESLDVTPREPVLPTAGDAQKVLVLANYSDGSRRDVTADAFLETGDANVAIVDSKLQVIGEGRGETPLTARYEGAYAATMVTVLGKREGFAWQPAPVLSKIDALVDEKLKRLQIAPSGLCSDEEFVRRVTLDLTGRLPTVEELDAFLADPRSGIEKRGALVDRLVGSDAYVDYRTNRWANLLLVASKSLGVEGAVGFRDWIHQQVAGNRPYDEFAYEILTATGSNREHPQAGYIKSLRTPERLVEATTQLFLGVRFNCNRCHDHPFERWTQQDHTRLAAYFNEVEFAEDKASGGRKIAGSAVEEARPLFEFVTDVDLDDAGADVKSTAVEPRFPYESPHEEQPSDTRREAFANWLATGENRYFARSYVNRIWAELTGVGMIEPVDDLRAGNPPTNPKLLDWLTEQFVASGFDTQSLVRTICKSRTYQLSSETNRWNEDDRRNYSHALPRRLPAEALYDAIHQATGSQPRFAGEAGATRAVQLSDAATKSPGGLLDTLGRPARESVCVCERSSDLELGAIMAMLNGADVAEALVDPNNALSKLEREHADDGALLDAVFRRFLSRLPTREERKASLRLLRDVADERPATIAAAAERRAALLESFENWAAANRSQRWLPLENVNAQREDSTKSKWVARGKAGKGKLAGLRLVIRTSGEERSSEPLAINELRVYFGRPGQTEEMRRVKLRSAIASTSEGGELAANVIDGKAETEWKFTLDEAGVQGVFEFVRPMGYSGGTTLRVEAEASAATLQRLGDVRLATTTERNPRLAVERPSEITALLSKPLESLSSGKRAALQAYYLEMDPTYRELSRAERLLANPRLSTVQDIAWALLNSPGFLFNH